MRVEGLGRAVPDLDQASERDTRRRRVDLRLAARVLHRRLPRLVLALLLPVEAEGDGLEGHVAAREDFTRQAPDAVEVPGRDSQLVPGGKGRRSLVAVRPFAGFGGLEDLEIGRTNV